jgi:S1-C subfamily serine protease
MLAGLEERSRPAAARFACPMPAAPDIACSDGTSYRVGSLRTDLAPIVSAGRPTPIVSNGLVTGLRLEAAVAPLGLEAGDIVLAVAGRLVTSRAMLADRIAQARGETRLTIRRGTTEKVLQFAER